MTDHIAEVHTNCTKEHVCWICDSGLFVCTECGSAEGATTSECPQTHQEAGIMDLVYNGQLDFVGNRWTVPNFLGHNAF